MEKENLLKLITEHKASLLNLRSLANKIINLVNLSVDDDSKAMEALEKIAAKDNVISVFLKISSFLIKLIPLEQQLTGVHMLKQDEINKLLGSEKSTEVTEEDIEILKNFINHHYSENKSDKRGKS